jgi:hypothetical protein
VLSQLRITQVLEVSDFGRVAGVPDYYARKVDALVAKNALLLQPTLTSSLHMGGDRNAGLPVRLRDGAQDALGLRA